MCLLVITYIVTQNIDTVNLTLRRNKKVISLQTLQSKLRNQSHQIIIESDQYFQLIYCIDETVSDCQYYKIISKNYSLQLNKQQFEPDLENKTFNYIIIQLHNSKTAVVQINEYDFTNDTRISIIVNNYNKLSYLSRLLFSIRRQDIFWNKNEFVEFQDKDSHDSNQQDDDYQKEEQEENQLSSQEQFIQVVQQIENDTQKRYSTNTHIQLLFVDDGSQDKSIKFVVQFLKQFPITKLNLVVIKLNTNKGLLNGRLCAYEELQTTKNYQLDYSLIVDADDTLQNRTLISKTINIINNFYKEAYIQLEIIKFNSFDIYTDKKNKTFFKYNTIPLYYGYKRKVYATEFVEEHIKQQRTCYIWGQFILNQVLLTILNNTYQLRNNQINHLEDLLQYMPALLHINHYYGYQTIVGYNYYINQDSIMRTHNNNVYAVRNALIAYQHFKKFNYQILPEHALETKYFFKQRFKFYQEIVNYIKLEDLYNQNQQIENFKAI